MEVFRNLCLENNISPSRMFLSLKVLYIPRLLAGLGIGSKEHLHRKSKKCHGVYMSSSFSGGL